MKALLSRLWIGAACAFTPFVSAEELQVVSSETREEVIALRSAEELNRLVARIALYPDVLVALILPSATTPTDVVLAARAIKAAPQRTNFDAEPWSDSVKGLAHYREVVEMLDENIGWTNDLGDAFLAQPADVMNAIQRMRLQAKSGGYLKDTPQQVVVVEEEIVKIYPRETRVVYVPRYDYDVLFLGSRYESRDAFLTFGLGFTAGAWLSYDCDWRHNRIWVIPPAHRHTVWAHHRHWNHWSHDHRRHNHWHAWNPPPRRHHHIDRPGRSHVHRDHGHRDRGRDHVDRVRPDRRPERANLTPRPDRERERRNRQVQANLNDNRVGGVMRHGSEAQRPERMNRESRVERRRDQVNLPQPEARRVDREQARRNVPLSNNQGPRADRGNREGRSHRESRASSMTSTADAPRPAGRTAPQVHSVPAPKVQSIPEASRSNNQVHRIDPPARSGGDRSNSFRESRRGGDSGGGGGVMRHGSGGGGGRNHGGGGREGR